MDNTASIAMFRLKYHSQGFTLRPGLGLKHTFAHRDGWAQPV